MTIGWGIIGCDQLAGAQIAPVINLTPEAKLVAVMSRSIGKGRESAEKHGAPRAYDDLDDFLGECPAQAYSRLPASEDRTPRGCRTAGLQTAQSPLSRFLYLSPSVSQSGSTIEHELVS